MLPGSPTPLITVTAAECAGPPGRALPAVQLQPPLCAPTRGVERFQRSPRARARPAGPRHLAQAPRGLARLSLPGCCRERRVPACRRSAGQQLRRLSQPAARRGSAPPRQHRPAWEGARVAELGVLPCQRAPAGEGVGGLDRRAVVAALQSPLPMSILNTVQEAAEGRAAATARAQGTGLRAGSRARGPHSSTRSRDCSQATSSSSTRPLTAPPSRSATRSRSSRRRLAGAAAAAVQTSRPQLCALRATSPSSSSPASLPA